jgi:hypothetical protein
MGLIFRNLILMFKEYEYTFYFLKFTFEDLRITILPNRELVYEFYKKH